VDECRRAQEGDHVRSYSQYCPISRAAEILGDRWTLLLVRDLLVGSTRFSELARGNPGLSRALLARRLDQLQRAGLVVRTDDGRYHPSAAGEDLRSVVMDLAEWGARWAFGEPEPHELDPDLLLWWLHRSIERSALPEGRFVIHVRFDDHRRLYWIVVEAEPSVCLKDPGFPVDVTLRTSRAALYRVYLGRQPLGDALARREIELAGRSQAVRAATAAFVPSPVADLVARGVAMTGPDWP
jgi:DNA-binding HxlR family transcriptional regulator